MIPEFTIIKTDSKNRTVSYVDCTTGPTDTLMEMKVCSQSIDLPEVPMDSDFKKLAADFLNDNIHEIVEFPKFLSAGLSHYQYLSNHDDCIKRKIQLKLLMTCNYIGHKCRMGKPNTIVVNTATDGKYNECYERDMIIVINDYVPNDVFYMLRNVDIDQPGYKCFYTIEEDKLYLDIVGVGLSPDKTAAKFVIY